MLALYMSCSSFNSSSAKYFVACCMFCNKCF